MAGNIIPAIATTNAIIAGVVVLQAFRVLQNQLSKCQTVYLRLKPNHRKQILVPEKYLIPPKKNCYICSEKPEVTLLANVDKMTVKELEEAVLKKALNMAAPDVILDSTGMVVISSEEDEIEKCDEKVLSVSFFYFYYYSISCVNFINFCLNVNFIFFLGIGNQRWLFT